MWTGDTFAFTLCTKCGHNVPFESGLADQITICPRCILSAFTLLFYYFHVIKQIVVQSQKTHFLMPGVKGFLLSVCVDSHNNYKHQDPQYVNFSCVETSR